MRSQILVCFRYRMGVFLLLGVLFFLPSFSRANEKEVSPEEKVKKIVVLGDSLTEGYGVAKGDAFPALLEQKIKEELKRSVQVINAGIGGSTSASAPGRLKWVLKGKPDLLILALGGNDGLRGFNLASTEKNLSQTIELAQSHGLKVILAGMKIPPNYGKKYTKNFRAIFPLLAKKYKIDLIPFLLEGVGGERDLNLPDGIHPNEEGHQKIAETLYQFLKDKI